jgi:hypothetical protein
MAGSTPSSDAPPPPYSSALIAGLRSTERYTATCGAGKAWGWLSISHKSIHDALRSQVPPVQTLMLNCAAHGRRAPRPSPAAQPHLQLRRPHKQSECGERRQVAREDVLGAAQHKGAGLRLQLPAGSWGACGGARLLSGSDCGGQTPQASCQPPY